MDISGFRPLNLKAVVLLVMITCSCSLESKEKANSAKETKSVESTKNTAVKTESKKEDNNVPGGMPKSLKYFDFNAVVKPLEDHDNYITPARGEAELKAQKVIKKAALLLEKEKWSEALDMVQKELKECPEYAPLWNLKGIAYTETNNSQGALAAFERAVVLDPRYYNAWKNYGIVLARTRQYSEAEKVFLYLRKLVPDEPKVLLVLGNLRIESQDGYGAIKYFQKGLSMNDKDPDLWNRLAYTYHGMKQYDKAITTYEKALTVDPKHLMARKYLGILYLNKKDFASAEKEFKRLIKDFPDNHIGWYQMGYLFRNKGEWKKAIDCYMKASVIGKKDGSGGDADSLVEAALVYEHLGDKERSRSLFREARKRAPGWYRPVFKLGTLALDEFKYDEAAKMFHHALELDPTNYRIYNSLGCALAFDGKEDKAAIAFRNAVKFNPRFALGWGNLAETMRMMGNPEKAFEYNMKSLRLNPRSPNQLTNIGRHYLVKNDLEKARKFIDKAVEIDPSYAFAWSTKGLLMIGVGDLKSAEKYLLKATSLDKEDSSTWTNLAEVYKRTGEKKKRVEALKMASKAHKGSRPEDLYRIAHSLETMGHKKEASMVRKTGLELDPEEADVLMNVPLIMDQAKEEGKFK